MLERPEPAALPLWSGPEPRGLPAPDLLAAIDAAAAGEGGMTFHGPRGAVTGTMSWRDLAEETRHAAGQLAALGLPQGARVFLLAETGPAFLGLFVGAMRAGLVPCPAPLPFAFGSREAYIARLRRLVGDAPAVIAPGMFADWLAEGFRDAPRAFAGGADDLPDPAPVADRRPAAEDTAYVQFSSGTTSAPKGIAVSHGALMANLRAMARALRITPADRGVSWLPWYHDMGLVGTVLLPIVSRMSIDFLSTRDFTVRPTLWLDLISRRRATISYAPSFGYELAARRAKAAEGLDLSSWRVAGIGGDMVRAEALDRFSEAFHAAGFDPAAFVPSYGMAEATLGVTFTPVGRGARFERVDAARLDIGSRAGTPTAGRTTRLALCGRPLDGHAVEIRDRDGTPMADGRVGRIFVRGPGLMSGYDGDPAATARTLGPDGWLETGDLGYLRRGELVVAGREKDVLMLHGRAVWPQDVEWSVTGASGVSGLGDAALVRMPSPEGGLDDGPMVLILELREGDPARRAEIAAAVQRRVREEHGIDVELALWPPRSLPRTSSGKIRRAQALEMHLASLAGEPLAAGARA